MTIQTGVPLKIHFANVTNIAEIQMLFLVVFDGHLCRIETAFAHQTLIVVDEHGVDVTFARTIFTQRSTFRYVLLQHTKCFVRYRTPRASVKFFRMRADAMNMQQCNRFDRINTQWTFECHFQCSSDLVFRKFREKKRFSVVLCCFNYGVVDNIKTDKYKSNTGQMSETVTTAASQ